MTNLILLLLFSVSLVLPMPGPRNRPPVAADDHYFILYHPVQEVEIPVLENDTDPDGDVLHVTSVPAVDGGKVEIVDGEFIRIYIDWSQWVPDDYYTPVAHGTYVVSDGKAFTTANWAVWYFPEVPPATP
ncbi:MAG: Ig-like domain-containing protein [Caldilineales bacterium]